MKIYQQSLSLLDNNPVSCPLYLGDIRFPQLILLATFTQLTLYIDVFYNLFTSYLYLKIVTVQKHTSSKTSSQRHGYCIHAVVGIKILEYIIQCHGLSSLPVSPRSPGHIFFITTLNTNFFFSEWVRENREYVT